MNRRILLLITDLEIGGTPTVVRELAIRLNDPVGGVTVQVACLAKWGPVADQLHAAGIEVTSFNARSVWNVIHAVCQLHALIRRRRIDTVFSFLIHANTVAAIASRGMDEVRWIQSIQTTQLRPRWHWWVQSWIHECAEKIVVPSSAVAEAAHRRSRVPIEKIQIIPNAIDPAEFPRVEVFHRTPIRIGFLGRLDPVKNVPALVDAMRLLGDRSVECHIFGDGPARGEIEKQIERTMQGGRIFLHGPVSRPQIALAEMDMLVLPSLGEGFGLVLIEAMASGVPVIGSAKRGAAAAGDIITDGVDGLLLPGVQFDREIADGVRRLIDEPELRDRLIENALRTVRERFTWERVLLMYQSAIGLHAG